MDRYFFIITTILLQGNLIIECDMQNKNKSWIKMDNDLIGWHTVVGPDFIDIVDDGSSMVTSFLNSNQRFYYKLINKNLNLYEDNKANRIAVQKKDGELLVSNNNNTQHYYRIDDFKTIYTISPSQSNIKGNWSVVSSPDDRFQFNISKHNIAGYNDCLINESGNKLLLYWKIHTKGKLSILETLTPSLGKRELFVITKFENGFMRLEHRKDNKSVTIVLRKVES